MTKRPVQVIPRRLTESEAEALSRRLLRKSDEQLAGLSAFIEREHAKAADIESLQAALRIECARVKAELEAFAEGLYREIEGSGLQ